MKSNPLKDGTLKKNSKGLGPNDGSDLDPKQAILESAPESERWDPLPGSTGHKRVPTPSEDEDAEGRSDNERLVEEGVAEAEDDRQRRAIRQAKKLD